jgi:hypothetical protein
MRSRRGDLVCDVTGVLLVLLGVWMCPVKQPSRQCVSQLCKEHIGIGEAVRVRTL